MSYNRKSFPNNESSEEKETKKLPMEIEVEKHKEEFLRQFELEKQLRKALKENNTKEVETLLTTLTKDYPYFDINICEIRFLPLQMCIIHKVKNDGYLTNSDYAAFLRYGLNLSESDVNYIGVPFLSDDDDIFVQQTKINLDNLAEEENKVRKSITNDQEKNRINDLAELYQVIKDRDKNARKIQIDILLQNPEEKLNQNVVKYDEFNNFCPFINYYFTNVTRPKLEIVKLLIDKGANPNIMANTYSIILGKYRRNHNKPIDFLLEFDVSTDTNDVKCITDILYLLIEHKAKFDSTNLLEYLGKFKSRQFLDLYITINGVDMDLHPKQKEKIVKIHSLGFQSVSDLDNYISEKLKSIVDSELKLVKERLPDDIAKLSLSLSDNYRNKFFSENKKIKSENDNKSDVTSYSRVTSNEESKKLSGSIFGNIKEKLRELHEQISREIINLKSNVKEISNRETVLEGIASNIETSFEGIRLHIVRDLSHSTSDDETITTLHELYYEIPKQTKWISDEFINNKKYDEMWAKKDGKTELTKIVKILSDMHQYLDSQWDELLKNQSLDSGVILGKDKFTIHSNSSTRVENKR